MRLRFSPRCALCACLVAALLTACSVSTLQRLDPSIASSTSANANHGARHRSWINTRHPTTVFFSVAGTGAVFGYDAKTGTQTEELSNFGGLSPYGLATDKVGNLYVAAANQDSQSSVMVFPPGSTNPSLTLTFPGNFPWGVAVSSLGEVAATDYFGDSVYFYKKGATTPFNAVTSSDIQREGFICYDAAGNAYFSATDASGAYVVAEIVGGGKGNSVSILSLTNKPYVQGVGADDNNHLLVLDGKAYVIYQYSLPKPTSPVGTIPLGNAINPQGFALTKSDKTFWEADYDDVTVSKYSYPAGGWPKQFIRSPGSAVGVAVSPLSNP
jgi:DNA-binding beta-propeller fold protein YncE